MLFVCATKGSALNKDTEKSLDYNQDTFYNLAYHKEHSVVKVAEISRENFKVQVLIKSIRCLKGRARVIFKAAAAGNNTGNTRVFNKILRHRTDSHKPQL